MLLDRSVTGASETEQYNGRIVWTVSLPAPRQPGKRGIPVGLGTDTAAPHHSLRYVAEVLISTSSAA